MRNVQDVTRISDVKIEITEEGIENKYVNWLVEGIKDPRTIPTYHDTPYVSYCLAGISLEEVDYGWLMEKFQLVIDDYNSLHDLQLKMTSEITNEVYLSIEVKSTNLEYLEKPVNRVGQLAHVELGTVYWESSQNFGSGKSSMVSTKNVYIPDNCIVTVNGVAYLDYKGNILYSSYGNMQGIQIWEKRMFHICANGIDLGWVYPTHLTRAE